MLPRLFVALQESNPGTLVEWKHNELFDNETIVFGSVFWAFDLAIEGFKSCRPIISVDDTHLYRRFRGKLIAVAFDVDNEIFPLAYALLEEENNVN